MIVHTKGQPLSAAVLKALVADLRAGEVAIFPTETVYGLGANVFSPEAIRRVYELKGRGGRKPLSLLVSSLAAAQPLVEVIPAEAFRVAERFCPGPLTLVLKASALGRMVTGGLETIGIRVPDHDIALSILKAIEIPLATTSVNVSGEPPATSGTAAARVFGAKVRWMIHGGRCRLKAPSSVVDFSSYPFTVIREGAIAKRDLEAALLGH